MPSLQLTDGSAWLCGPSCGLAVLRLRLKGFPAPHSLLEKHILATAPRASCSTAGVFCPEHPVPPAAHTCTACVTAPPCQPLRPSSDLFCSTSSASSSSDLRQSSPLSPPDWPPTAAPRRLLFTSGWSCPLPLRASHSSHSPQAQCALSPKFSSSEMKGAPPRPPNATLSKPIGYLKLLGHFR